MEKKAMTSEEYEEHYVDQEEFYDQRYRDDFASWAKQARRIANEWLLLAELMEKKPDMPLPEIPGVNDRYGLPTKYRIIEGFRHYVEVISVEWHKRIRRYTYFES